MTPLLPLPPESAPRTGPLKWGDVMAWLRRIKGHDRIANTNGTVAETADGLRISLASGADDTPFAPVQSADGVTVNPGFVLSGSVWLLPTIFGLPAFTVPRPVVPLAGGRRYIWLAIEATAIIGRAQTWQFTDALTWEERDDWRWDGVTATSANIFVSSNPSEDDIAQPIDQTTDTAEPPNYSAQTRPGSSARVHVLLGIIDNGTVTPANVGHVQLSTGTPVELGTDEFEALPDLETILP